MQMQSPELYIAFAAGLLSFLSPCVLPLVPAYIGYLSGSAVRTQTAGGPTAMQAAQARWTVVTHALVFVLGFTLVFAVLGYIAVKTNYHVIAILIGILLGPLFEQYLLRSLRLGQGDLTILFSSTLGNALWVMVALSLFLPWLRTRQTQRALQRAGHTLPGGGRENVG